VRIAPDELSFANSQAWSEIYGLRAGNPLDKTEIWHAPPKGNPLSLVGAIDNTEHARIKKAIMPGFTERAVRDQEMVVQQYGQLMTDKLRELVKKGGGTAEVDIAHWFNYTTFDIIGDLGYGEPFGCLETGDYDEWIGITRTYFQGLAVTISLAYYPWIARIMKLFVPKQLKEARARVGAMTGDKIRRRLALEKSRPDIIGQIKHKGKGNDDGISLPELFSTSTQIIIAGSETTASISAGLVDKLLRNRDKLERLQSEVRGAFDEESQITFESVSRLPYLNAVIQEACRVCNPLPGGMPRQVPRGGAKVCGYWLPEKVRWVRQIKLRFLML
jgi:cytochrome P450